ncbi:folate-binding protein YgfZ [Pseudoalteromonas luteoviolacea]|uniref:CAF17-like 4Fe-4S cluster assembly/insertion protein YgfZ n=1 Tax=Pseudoalteromonas luteoviolacea TaxID=43657 RepID=UPI001B35AD8F|nr:folate-binding protein YgfZ [Pseudoalteromonas luteoviolacea]MBQ4812355.1 folate-binding protein YgfZ [Pseudoalteromonas luteoviolacea]
MAKAYQLPYKLLSISGADKLSYLHGQVTQDINLVKDTNFLWTGHCSPKGKLWSAMRVFALNENYFLLGSPQEAEASHRELNKYGVFAKVDIAMSDHHCFGVLSDTLDDLCTSLGIQFNDEDNACNFGDGKALKLDGKRLILILAANQKLPEMLEVEPDASQFEINGILAGEPQLHDNVIDEFVPQMVNLQALNGISFKKGCYTGQETVARMRYLGKNKRAMFIVHGESKAPIQIQDIEMQLEQDNWRRAGKVVHQVYDTQAQIYYALAVLPNDLQQSAVLRPKDNDSVRLHIKALPYSIEDK